MSVRPTPQPEPAWEKTVPRRRLKVLEPPRRWPRLELRELFQARDLLFMLVWRDISANYRQSVIGYGWALFKPVLSVLIYTLIFGKVAGLEAWVPVPPGATEWSRSLYYSAFCMTGLLPWMYFSTCLLSISNSTVSNGHLLTKVYFPRLILPLAALFTGLIEFAVQFLLLILLLCLVELPTWHLFMAPVILLYTALTALAVGMWLTALNVKYRDIGHIVPFLIQMWMWLTPVVYPIDALPSEFRLLYGLNPMVSVVEAFRWSVLSIDASHWDVMWPSMVISTAVMLMLFCGGLIFFRKTEQTFADLI